MASSRTLARQRASVSGTVDNVVTLPRVPKKREREKGIWRLAGKLSLLVLLTTLVVTALVAYRIVEEVFSTVPRSVPLTWVYALGGLLIAPFAPVDSVQPIKDTGYVDFPGLVALEIYLVGGVALSFWLYASSRVMRRIARMQLTWADVVQPFVYGAGWLVAETMVAFSTTDRWLSEELDLRIAATRASWRKWSQRAYEAYWASDAWLSDELDYRIGAVHAWWLIQWPRAQKAFWATDAWLSAELDYRLAAALVVWRAQRDRLHAAYVAADQWLSLRLDASIACFETRIWPWCRLQASRMRATAVVAWVRFEGWLKTAAAWTVAWLASVWLDLRLDWRLLRGAVADFRQSHAEHDPQAAALEGAPQLSRRAFLRRVRVLPPER